MNKAEAIGGSRVEENLDMCELVIRYRNGDGEIVHWSKDFLNEAYATCKTKGLYVDEFTDLMEIERHANGHLNFNSWDTSICAENVIEGLDYVNQTVHYEGHYTQGPFFKWLWEQDRHTQKDEKSGYLYILKQPNRFGIGKQYAFQVEEDL